MKPTKKQAFTIVEVLLVVVIIGILAAQVLPRYANSSQTARQNACDANVKNLNSQWELKYVQRNLSTYPSFSELTEDTNYFPGEPPVCPFETPYQDADSNNRVEFHDHSNLQTTTTTSSTTTTTLAQPTITTQGATNIGRRNARLNMSYNFQSYSGTVNFQYKKSSDSSWTSTPSSGTLSGAGTYFRQIASLDTDTSYDFYAELSCNSTTIQGTTLQFTTLP